MEMNFGSWELKRWDDLDKDALNKWMNSYTTERCHDGESYADVIARVKHFIHDALQNSNQRAIVVTHGGVIKSFHGIVHNRDGMDFKISYGEVYQFNGTIV